MSQLAYSMLSHIITRVFRPAQLSLLTAVRRAGPRPLLGLFLVIPTALSLAGCARPASAVQFTAGGAKLALFESPPKRGGEGTPLFSLARPVPVDRAGMAFFLRYSTGERSLTVEIYGRERSGGAERTVSAALPVVGDAVELMVPLPDGVEVTGFRVEGLRAPSELAIRAAGIAPLGPGVAPGSKLVSLRPGYGYAVSDGPASASAGGAAGPAGSPAKIETFSFAQVTRAIRGEQHASQVQVVLTYAFGPSAEASAPTGPPASAAGEKTEGAPQRAGAGGQASGNVAAVSFPGKVVITASRGDEERSYLLTPNPGEHTVYLYTASCRFSPESLRVVSSDPAFRVVALDVNPFSPDRMAPATPIPADLGTILTYDPSDWRTKDFELFSWSLVPDVLVFDFRSYGVEGDYLSRFAYFIEKKGFRGRLMTTAELAGLRGWNAHDYRPQDIARLYQTAQEEHFTLRPEEYRLRDLLVANGIIKQVGGRWEPGKGALISVAQSSWFGLRYLLLTHEAFHGIYFTHPAYREAVHAVWDHVDPTERLFWRLLFGSEEYDPTDRYLMVNEFQAYLMQQPLAAVDARYRGWAVGHVERQFPDQAPALKRMMADHPRIFLDTAKELDAAVYRTAGVHAGELVTLVPQNWR